MRFTGVQSKQVVIALQTQHVPIPCSVLCRCLESIALKCKQKLKLSIVAISVYEEPAAAVFESWPSPAGILSY
jgi:hypothetical protein